MGYALKSLSTTVTEPVALVDMKAHLNIDPSFTDDDDLISSLISAARQDAEDYLGHSLVAQQWLLALDSFPRYNAIYGAPSRSDYDALGNFTARGIPTDPQTIRLPRPPLSSVNLVQYVDLTNTLQTLDPSLYQVDTISEPGRLLPAYGSDWPATAPVANAVQITFTGGTGSIPPNTALAIKLRAANYYANREEFAAGTVPPNDSVFERMLGSQGRTNIFGYVER